MSFSKPLPFPTRQSELVSRKGSTISDLFLTTKLMSPLSPGKYQHFFNLSPISPSSLPVGTNSIEEVAGRPTSMQAANVAENDTEMVLSQDGHTQLNTDLRYPSFSALEDDITNLDAWLYNNNLVSPTQLTTQQFLDTDFFANLPNPVFDTDVFAKSPTPIVAAFSDLELDPLLRYEQGPFDIIHSQPSSWNQGQFGSTQTQPDCSQMQPSYPDPNDMPRQHPYYSQGAATHFEQAIAQPAPVALMTAPRLPSQDQVRSKTASSTANGTSRPLKRKAIDNTHTLYPAERPNKPITQPHIRTNITTKGLTTRTGKINHYDASKDGGYVPLPQPKPWRDAATGLMFTYNVHGELFSPQTQAKSHSQHDHNTNNTNPGIPPAITFTPAQLTTYLLSSSNPNPPTLFLQRTPADSARRYPTTTSSTCRLTHCPGRGKIGVGSYRVAIDERWHACSSAENESQSDPFVVAAYVHLYCLERWCDVRMLVSKGVKFEVDERVLKQEPKGRFAPSLKGCAEVSVAREFLAALRLTSSEERENALGKLFPNGGYAAHSSSGEPRKPHSNTLTHALHKTKLDKMPASRVRQQADRGMNPGNVLVHLGDLEVSEAARECGGGIGGGGRWRVERRFQEEGYKVKTVRGMRRRRESERVERMGRGRDEESDVEEEEEEEEEVEEEEWKPAKRVRRG